MASPAVSRRSGAGVTPTRRSASLSRSSVQTQQAEEREQLSSEPSRLDDAIGELEGRSRDYERGTSAAAEAERAAEGDVSKAAAAFAAADESLVLRA